MEPARRMLVLCRDASTERRMEVAGCVAAAVASGWRVDLVLFSAALDRWCEDRWRGLGTDGPDALAEAIAAGRMRSPAELIEGAREAGGLRVLACSASAAGRGLEPAAEAVDAIVGWPTVLELSERARHVLQF